MKKILIISLFVLGLIIPNIDVKAVDVSNEEELRAAIEQGGDITLTQNIEIKKPLVIDKDVNISNKSILMQGDNTLMTINSGNVTLNVDLYAGWNGKHDEWGYPLTDVVKNQGKALVVDGGIINFANTEINAGNIGLEINNGKIVINFRKGSISGNNIGIKINGGDSVINFFDYEDATLISAGEKSDGNFFGGNALIINGGTVVFDSTKLFSLVEGHQASFVSGGTAIKINKNSKVNFNGNYQNNMDGDNCSPFRFCGDGISLNIKSYEENGIEINDNSVANITNAIIYGMKNAIYLNGGIVDLKGRTTLSSSNTGFSLYINKGVNKSLNNDVLIFDDNFAFSSLYTYSYFTNTTATMSNIYVNPDIRELYITDKKNFFNYENNKIKFNFCSNNASATNIGNGVSLCASLDANYDGPVYSNELGKCTTVYINGVKQNEVDASCNLVANNENTENNNQSLQVVEVPSTSAYGSIIIAILGLVCVIVSVFVMSKMTNKAN